MSDLAIRAEGVTIDAEAARRLTDQIKAAVEVTWQLIIDAYVTRAWSVLGYSTWDDYCTREFGASRLRLPREERSEVVGSLRDAGLSNRAIAAATGESEPTVRRALGASNGAPVIGTDGKTYTRPEPDEDAIAAALARRGRHPDGRAMTADEMPRPTPRPDVPPGTTETCPRCDGAGRVRVW